MEYRNVSDGDVKDSPVVPLTNEQAMRVVAKAANEIRSLLFSNVIFAGCDPNVIAPFMLHLAVSEMRQCGYNFDEVRDRLQNALMAAPDSLPPLKWSQTDLDKLHDFVSKPRRSPLGRPEVNRILRSASEDIQFIVLSNVVLAGCSPDYIPMLTVFVMIGIMQDIGFSGADIRAKLQDALGKVLAVNQGSKVELDFDFP